MDPQDVARLESAVLQIASELRAIRNVLTVLHADLASTAQLPNRFAHARAEISTKRQAPPYPDALRIEDHVDKAIGAKW